MFELYIFVIAAWWIALIVSATRSNHLDSWLPILVGVTLAGDVFMGLAFLEWLTNAPLFQEMTNEANRKVFTHFLVPWFAPQVVLLMGFVGYVYLDSRRIPSIREAVEPQPTKED